MDLIDRYGRERLYAAGFQVLLFLSLLVYGLWSPTLGTRLLWPVLVMAPIYAVLVWFALHRPIDWSWQTSRDIPRDGQGAWGRKWTRTYSLWDPALFVGFTFGIARLHYGVITNGKKHLEENLSLAATNPLLAALERTTEADTFGYLLVSGPALIVAVLMPLALLGLLWAFLPR